MSARPDAASQMQHATGEQQVMDCSLGFGNEGCLTGSVQNAFAYVVDASRNATLGGLSRECNYTYRDSAQACQSSRYQ